MGSVRDIFLCGPISNGSDALDKIHYLSSTDPTCLETKHGLYIRITRDKANKCLVIGMIKAGVVSSLGAIAKSNPKIFLETLSSGTGISMVCQLCAGSCLANPVAHPITGQVILGRNDEQHVCESGAGGTSMITPDAINTTLCCGLEMRLYIKKCLDLFTEILEDKDNYNKFHETFIKLGIHEDAQNHSKPLPFHSMKTTDSLKGGRCGSIDPWQVLVRLCARVADYITRISEVQKSSSYLTGEYLAPIRSLRLSRSPRRRVSRALHSSPLLLLLYSLFTPCICAQVSVAEAIDCITW